MKAFKKSNQNRKHQGTFGGSLFIMKCLIVSVSIKDFGDPSCIFASGQEAKVVMVWEVWIQVNDQVLNAAHATVSPSYIMLSAKCLFYPHIE